MRFIEIPLVRADPFIVSLPSGVHKCLHSLANKTGEGGCKVVNEEKGKQTASLKDTIEQLLPKGWHGTQKSVFKSITRCIMFYFL